jgi:extracellular elastinolytic metalloproteinase
MTRSRRPSGLVALAALVATVAAVAGTGPAVAARRQPVGGGFQGENGTPRDIDRREGRLQPTRGQNRAAAALGATVRWNEFGTPATLIDYGGFLATGLPEDPGEAAIAFLQENRELFRLSPAELTNLEVVAVNPIGAGSTVLLRQRIGGLPASPDGLAAVAVVDGNVAYVSSSLTGETTTPEPATLTAEEALIAAAEDFGRPLDASDVERTGTRGAWTTLKAEGLTGRQFAQLVAVPTADQGVRTAYQTSIVDGDRGEAFTHFVDARTGEVLIRYNDVDFLGEPKWDFFEGYPPVDYSTTDTRRTWCWTAAPDCDLVIPQDPGATPFEWDVDPATGLSTNTTNGNDSRTVHNWFSNDPFTVGTVFATARPGRDYQYGWTNQWFEERCNPDTTFFTPEANDVDAAIANLHVGHNLMHDWSYRLGFTETAWNAQVENLNRGGAEGDPEQGNAQAGGVTGGPPGFAARDNANQITRADGIAPITNMYLWQPIAGAFYAPCVDGDFDMSVIGHEFTHMISNRMAAGPNVGLSGNQAGAMGESWSDLAAMEIANEYGWLPVGGESPYAVGAYVTGDPVAAIRNYNMSDSNLNYSDVGYDFVCNQATCPALTQVHADGEIWSAANFDIRQAMNARYGSGSTDGQVACANGVTPVGSCPGNRRWIQLVFDAWLNMAVGTVSMVDARDAMLAADMVRFGGANQDLLWNAFAKRGFGRFATTTGTADADPVPDFTSPYATEGTIVFNPVDENEDPIVGAELFVGDYEARVTPVADTNPATPLDETVDLVPGTYDLIARADGFGHKRYSVNLKARQVLAGDVNMPGNLASMASGATIVGNGINLTKLIDDTEETNWASLGSPAIGKSVTIRLDPSAPSHQIKRIQVSAMLRHRIPADPGGDTATQSRFSALRQFAIYTCRVTASVDCADDGEFSLIYTSPADAFPSIAPRPRAPELVIRSFDIPDVRATYVRLVVLHNQCTGTPGYQGDQDDDPLNVTDCEVGSTQDDNVRAAELQVFRK